MFGYRSTGFRDQNMYCKRLTQDVVPIIVARSAVDRHFEEHPLRPDATSYLCLPKHHIEFTEHTAADDLFLEIFSLLENFSIVYSRRIVY